MLKTTGKRTEFTVHGRSAVFVARELTDPTDARVGLKLIYFAVPAKSYVLSVFRVGPEGTEAALKRNSSSESAAIALVNGGYYGTNDNKKYYPLGLLVHDGQKLNPQRNWVSGGVVYTKEGDARITSISSFRLSQDMREGLQSKPLLVENSRSGMRSDDHQYANRTAVALREDGTMVIAGAFSPSNNAMTLAEFADFLRAPSSAGGAGASVALNLDGGPSALIICPVLNLRFGSSSDLFIPDAIRISAR